MRYYYEKDTNYISRNNSFTTICETNNLFSRYTLYIIGEKGLGVIQQRFNPINKYTYWTEVDAGLDFDIYYHPRFKEYFDEHSGVKNDNDGYPVVPVRKIMWALRMKPLKKERWETVFDRQFV